MSSISQGVHQSRYYLALQHEEYPCWFQNKGDLCAGPIQSDPTNVTYLNRQVTEKPVWKVLIAEISRLDLLLYPLEDIVRLNELSRYVLLEEKFRLLPLSGIQLQRSLA